MSVCMLLEPALVSEPTTYFDPIHYSQFIIITRNYLYLGFDELFVLGLMWFHLTRLAMSVMNYWVSHRTGRQGRDVAMRVS